MGKSRSTNTAQREGQWRDHLARQATSGQSIAAFCRAQALSEGNFYAWRTRLQSNASKGLTSTAPFIDLGIVKSASGHPAAPRPEKTQNASVARIEVRIDLGEGMVLTIARY